MTPNALPPDLTGQVRPILCKFAKGREIAGMRGDSPGLQKVHWLPFGGVALRRRSGDGAGRPRSVSSFVPSPRTDRSCAELSLGVPFGCFDEQETVLMWRTWATQRRSPRLSNSTQRTPYAQQVQRRVAQDLLHLLRWLLQQAAPRIARRTKGRYGYIAMVRLADGPLPLLTIALRLEAVALDQPLYLHAVLVEQLRHASDVAVILA